MPAWAMWGRVWKDTHLPTLDFASKSVEGMHRNTGLRFVKEKRLCEEPNRPLRTWHASELALTTALCFGDRPAPLARSTQAVPTRRGLAVVESVESVRTCNAQSPPVEWKIRDSPSVSARLGPRAALPSPPTVRRGKRCSGETPGESVCPANEYAGVFVRPVVKGRAVFFFFVRR